MLAGRLYLSGADRLDDDERALVRGGPCAHRGLRRTGRSRTDLPFWPLGLPGWTDAGPALGLRDDGPGVDVRAVPDGVAAATRCQLTSRCGARRPGAPASITLPVSPADSPLADRAGSTPAAPARVVDLATGRTRPGVDAAIRHRGTVRSAQSVQPNPRPPIVRSGHRFTAPRQEIPCTAAPQTSKEPLGEQPSRLAVSRWRAWSTGVQRPGARRPTATAATWPAPTAKLDGVKLTIWAAQNSNTVPKQVIERLRGGHRRQGRGRHHPRPVRAGRADQGRHRRQAGPGVLAADRVDAHRAQRQDEPAAPRRRAVAGQARRRRCATSPACSTAPATPRSSPARRSRASTTTRRSSPQTGSPPRPKNFDEMVAAARTLKAKGVTPFYEMGGDRWATQWWVQVQLADAAKDGLWDKRQQRQGEVHRPVVVDAIKKYKTLIDEGLFNTDIKTGDVRGPGRRRCWTARPPWSCRSTRSSASCRPRPTPPSWTRRSASSRSRRPATSARSSRTRPTRWSRSRPATPSGRPPPGSCWRTGWARATPTSSPTANTVSLQTAVPTPAGVPQALLDVHAALRRPRSVRCRRSPSPTPTCTSTWPT